MLNNPIYRSLFLFFFFGIYNRKIRSSLNNINFELKETLNKVTF